MREKRKKIWIDHFQTDLSARLAVYFILYQTALWALYYIDARLNTMGGVASEAVAVCGNLLTPVATIGLGLLFICDAMKMTHRIVGPMYRFRKTIQAVTAGEEINLVGLRNGDYLQEFKDELNEMLRALEQRGAITLKAAPADQKREPVAV